MAICCERHWKILKKEISNLPPSLAKWRKEICLGTPGKSRLAYSSKPPTVLPSIVSPPADLPPAAGTVYLGCD
eukprot:23319-Prymnesium_polylepis.1